jgi:hypothetical protein
LANFSAKTICDKRTLPVPGAQTERGVPGRRVLLGDKKPTSYFNFRVN